MFSIPVLCVLINGFLMLGLMISMSLLRMNKVKGEGDPKSLFEKVHKTQLLTGEYVPILVALILYINFQAQVQGVPVDSLTLLGMATATFGRVSFALRYVIDSFDFVGATATYVGFGALLISAAAYTL